MSAGTAISHKFTEVLRENGYKATPERLLLLEVLQQAPHPLTIQDIMKKLEGKVNQATVYRTLDSLIRVRVIRRIDMQHSHTHYELAVGTKHHHHLICRSCGRSEDVDECDVADIERLVLKNSQKFSAITDHSLEFFGFCKKCK